MPRAFANIVLLLALPAFAAGCIVIEDGVDRGSDASLTIENVSSFALAEIRVTTVDNPSWGPNLIRGDLLFPGESITVLVECDIYDVLVVDEDGFGCELHDLELCFDDAVWVITDHTLSRCGF